MSSKNPGRPSNEEIHRRRKEVKELMLKEVSHTDMAKRLGVSLNTVQADVQFWNNYFRKMAVNNPKIAERQLTQIEKLIGEIALVRKEYWDIYSELVETAKANKQILQVWETEKADLKKKHDEAVANQQGAEKRRLEKVLQEYKYPPKLPNYYGSRLDTLKAILDRIDREAKLLNLFNPAMNLQQNYISVDTLKHFMEAVKTLIVDMIPEDRRKFAFERIRRVKIDEVNTDDVLDAEFKESEPEPVEETETPTESPDVPATDVPAEEVTDPFIGESPTEAVDNSEEIDI